MLMSQRKFRIIWLLICLFAVALACNTLSGAEQDVEDAKNTAIAVETQVSGVITQIGGLATALEESGAIETLAVLATQAAENGLWETAQVAITEQGSEILATLQAVATEGVAFGSAPTDIPLVDSSTLVNLVASKRAVSYSTTLDAPTVQAFYRREMPNYGWVNHPEQTKETASSVKYVFEKDGRTATVLIGVNPLDRKAVVAIFIQP
jgi:predicted small secreted protein